MNTSLLTPTNWFEAINFNFVGAFWLTPRLILLVLVLLLFLTILALSSFLFLFFFFFPFLLVLCALRPERRES